MRISEAYERFSVFGVKVWIRVQRFTGFRMKTRVTKCDLEIYRNASLDPQP